jgi:uncharacterized protein (UPF0303 family)
VTVSDTATIEMLKKQEADLQFDAFDENEAFALGIAVRDRAVREHLAIACDIRTWNRQLAFFAMPGTSPVLADWIRRKNFVVQRWGKSSYRALLENNRERLLRVDEGFDPADYALHGGAFPIRVKGTGVIGSVTISGLHEHDDHEIARTAICERLGLKAEDFALPPRPNA